VVEHRGLLGISERIGRLLAGYRFPDTIPALVAGTT